MPDPVAYCIDRAVRFRSAWTSGRGRALIASLVLALTLSLATPAFAQNPSEPGGSVVERTLQCSSKGTAANRALSAPRNLVPNGVDRLMAELDVFAQTRIAELVNAHHAEVERVLSQMTLLEDTGNFGMIWGQLRNSDEWQDRLRSLAARAAAEIEPSRESMLKFLQEDLSLALNEGLVTAQETIWNTYMEALQRHFPKIGDRVWYKSLDYSTLPQAENSEIDRIDDSLRMRATLGAGVGGIAGATLTRFAVKKITGKVVNKALAIAIGGPVGAVVGIMITAWDIAELAWNVWDAKERFEKEFRTRYLAAYREAVTSTAIWSGESNEGEDSLRGELESFVREALESVDASYREKARRLVPPELVSCMSPTADDYVSGQKRDGRPEDEIRGDLLLVGGVFDDGLISRVPFETLLDMALSVPSTERKQLRYLAGELNLPFVEEFDQHGKDMLDAARSLGAQTFIEAFRSGGTADWRALAKLFAQYPTELNGWARRGLFLSEREGVGRAAVPMETLGEIARRESLFGQAASLLRADGDRLYRLFGDSEALDVVARAFGRNPELAGAFATEWPVVVWRRYGGADRFDALWAVADYRLGEQGQHAGEFAREIGERDALTPRFLDAGLCAVRIWDEHAPPPAGDHQRRMAESGVELLKKRYPCENLLTQEGLDQAESYDSIPTVGKFMYDHLRNFPVIIQLAFYGLILIVVVWVGATVYRLLPSRGREGGAQRAATVRGGRAVESPPVASGGEGGEPPTLDRPETESLEDARGAGGHALPPPDRDPR